MKINNICNPHKLLLPDKLANALLIPIPVSDAPRGGRVGPGGLIILRLKIKLKKPIKVFTWRKSVAL